MKPMINDQNRHTWCVNAHHAFSGNNDGTTKICCMHRNHEEEIRLGVNTVDEIMNKDEFIEIRKSLDSGKRHDACTLCWQEEDSGRKSKRMRDNERYQWELDVGHLKSPYEGVAKVELNLGNTCNLSCRTCQPAISSGWYKEYFELYRKNEMTYKEFADSMKKYNLYYADDSPFWPDIEKNLPTIKQFDFYGGEPFMSKKMWHLLEVAVDKGYSKDISLHYNTNGTHWPKEVDLWKNFKMVNLSFSIDGIGDQFEYMRYPGKWDQAKQTIENSIKLKEQNKNMFLSWCITISTTNIFDLAETINHWHEYYKPHRIGLYLNLVHGPDYFNISHLPNELKEKAIANFDRVPKTNLDAWTWIPGIVNFIQNGEPRKDLWKTWLEKTEIHDAWRKQNYKETWPFLNMAARDYE